MPTCGLGNVHRAAADLKTDRKTGRKEEKRTEGGKKEKGGEKQQRCTERCLIMASRAVRRQVSFKARRPGLHPNSAPY